MDHDLLRAMRTLADPTRLRVAGACGAAPRTLADLAGDLGLPEPALRRHLERLAAAGLVRSSDTSPGSSEQAYSLRADAVRALGRRLAAIEASQAPGPDAPGHDGGRISNDEAKVVRGFIRDGRLTTIPSQEKKRLIVIRYLRDQCFAEDRSYEEKEVNQRLALFHPDVATLRRAMVDEGLMTRQAGVYRRRDPDVSEGAGG